MGRRLTVLACLVFSGLAALVYQIIWTRLLGLTFGHTTEAVGTVLAVFFGGLAIGNALAARLLSRVSSPLRLYALLELAIGLYAILSLPLLRNLAGVYGMVDAEYGSAAVGAVRLLLSAALLLPPTIAMGATLPLVGRGIVEEDKTLGRWSGLLYAANTAGAVLGAYLCGFWMIPLLGLTVSVLVGAACNVGVAVVILASRAARSLRWPTRAAPPPRDREAAPRALRSLMLTFFGISGFVAIGYEILWTKLLGIVMEGTLYGYATVLSAYLLGITLGSLAVAPFVDRIRDLTRAFGLLHLGVAGSVALGATIFPYLPYAYHRLAALGQGMDAVHLFFLLAAPVILVPTLLFGAAFPILIRIYTTRASAVGRGIGVATAVNTLGSILGSLVVGFWWIPSFGMDPSLLLLLLLQLGVGLTCLVRFHSGPARHRMARVAWAMAIALAVVSGFKGVHVEETIVGRGLGAVSGFPAYGAALEKGVADVTFRREGKTSIVTVHQSGTGRILQNNGLAESGVAYAPPYGNAAAVLLGVVPYLLTESPERVLLVGLGGARTLTALLETDVRTIDVVELEKRVVEALPVLHEGLPDPLNDPRVRLQIGDGRHELLRGRHGGGLGYDVIASQPSHPWLPGAANLFTEEYFSLARENLSARGIFALWINGFRTDPESLLAILTSFERVFPGSFLLEIPDEPARQAFLLLGARRAVEIDAASVRSRMETPGVQTALGLYGVKSLEDLLSLCEGPTAHFASIRPDLENTDDNAFVETRIPRLLRWETLDFARIENRLAADASALPPIRGDVNVAEVAAALLERGSKSEGGWPYGTKLHRLLGAHGADADPVLLKTLLAETKLREPEQRRAGIDALRSIARENPDRPEPLRLLARHFQSRGLVAESIESFEAAHARSGEPADAVGALELLYESDAERARMWLEKIPAAERGGFPQLALYEAREALARGASLDELSAHYERVIAFRDSPEGRAHPGVDEDLARIADALGRPTTSRMHRDADFATRSRRAGPYLRALEEAIEARDAGAARSSLARVEALLPVSVEVAELRARLAFIENNPAGFERAVAMLRRVTPTLSRAIAIENRLRAEYGLPLLPQSPPERLFGLRQAEP
jgi:spermidine synthase